MAAHGHIFGDVAVLDGERAGCEAHFPLLFKRHVAAFAHVLFAQNAGALVEHFLLERLDANAHSLCQGDLLVVELVLNLGNGGAERVGVDRVVVDVLVQNRTEVLHRGNAQNRAGNMDYRVHVGKADVHNGVAASRAVAFGDGIEAAQRLGTLNEVLGVLRGQSGAAQCDGAVHQRAGGLGNATLGVDAGAVRCGRPAADNHVLGAAHLAHHLAQLQAAVVVGDDVNDLAVFQHGDKLTEEHLVRNGGNAHDDELGALHCLGNGVGGHGELTLAHAAETVLGLRSRCLVLQRDARAHYRAQCALEERVQVADANFLPSQRAIGATRFANSATAEHRDGSLAQFLYVNQLNNLLLSKRQHVPGFDCPQPTLFNTQENAWGRLARRAPRRSSNTE